MIPAVRPKHESLRPRQPPKTPNNFCDGLFHFVESFDNRFALNDPRFVERYVEMKLHILLDFRFRDGEEYIACFQDADGLRRFQESAEVRERIARMALNEDPCDLLSLAWRHAMSDMSRSDSNQKAVFVDCVKAVETPDRVISSFVWFDRLDSVYRALSHSLYFSSRSGRAVFLKAVCNREASIDCRSIPSGLDKTAREMVKRAPKIVERVANNGSHFVREVAGADEVVAALSGVRIILESNFIRVGLEKAFTERLQILDVLCGPV